MLIREFHCIFEDKGRSLVSSRFVAFEIRKRKQQLTISYMYSQKFQYCLLNSVRLNCVLQENLIVEVIPTTKSKLTARQIGIANPLGWILIYIIVIEKK